eukprot:4278508-Ditylum_brightwellii.AAC.1
MPHQPQAAFAGYTHSLLQKAIEIEEHLLAPLGDAINTNLLPVLFYVPELSQDLFDLTLLPVNEGGLVALNPCQEAALNCTTSIDSTLRLVEAIL